MNQTKKEEKKQKKWGVREARPSGLNEKNYDLLMPDAYIMSFIHVSLISPLSYSRGAIHWRFVYIGSLPL
jgi:hypothetical protein